MPNESKIGMLAGIAVFLVVAVFFQGKPAAGTAFINNDPAPTTGATERTTPPPVPPAGVSVPDPTNRRSTWSPSEPREVKPVSRDPLLWP
jgi:hypothetical protein